MVRKTKTEEVAFDNRSPVEVEPLQSDVLPTRGLETSRDDDVCLVLLMYPSTWRSEEQEREVIHACVCLYIVYFRNACFQQFYLHFLK